MNLSTQIQISLQHLSMLKHPFYQNWSSGKLPLQAIQNYTLQYRPFVNRFPCYVAATLSQCENRDQRRALIHNLIDEEGYPDKVDHPTLWKAFALGVGVSNEDYEKSETTTWGLELDNHFWSRSRTSFASALGSLFAYEHQIPEISEVKIKGLKDFFDIDDSSTLEFFKVHQTADQYHTDACMKILNSFKDQEQKQQALTSAIDAARDLWTFLDHCENSCPSI